MNCAADVRLSPSVMAAISSSILTASMGGIRVGLIIFGIGSNRFFIFYSRVFICEDRDSVNCLLLGASHSIPVWRVHSSR